MKFQEATRRAQDEAMDHLSQTTRQDLNVMLKETGRIGEVFGDHELEHITAEAIREWCKLNDGLKFNTIDKHLYAMSFVFRWAIEEGYLKGNPVREYRAAFQRRNCKALRQEKDPSRNIRPLRPSSHKRLMDVCFARANSFREPAIASFPLLMLDAGLRVGEATALRWENVLDDSILVSENMPRHVQTPVAPKSGYTRRVQMSARLREWLEPIRGVNEERVIHPVGYMPFRRKHWPRILKDSGLSKVRFKDLRDTYASTLLSCGMPIAYIAKQLGHSNIRVTLNHYAQWLHDGWKPPVQLEEGQVPADLLEIISLGEQK